MMSSTIIYFVSLWIIEIWLPIFDFKLYSRERLDVQRFVIRQCFATEEGPRINKQKRLRDDIYLNNLTPGTIRLNSLMLFVRFKLIYD